ncbi:MAG: OsmC family protein [Chloroflexota bacterium]
MQVKAVWVSGRQFVGESGSGHALVMDASSRADGRNTGPSPMEMLLLGMAGCTGIDVVSILERGRHHVSGVEVAVEAERAPEAPMVFTCINVSYTVRGKNLSEKAVKRAIELSENRYCSASIMLGKTAEIHTRYTILEET